jgi:hypothetical protein
MASEIARLSSRCVGERLPTRGLDPDPTDLDHLAAGPDLLGCQGRQTVVDQPSDQARVKAV